MFVLSVFAVDIIVEISILSSMIKLVDSIGYLVELVGAHIIFGNFVIHLYCCYYPPYLPNDLFKKTTSQIFEKSSSKKNLVLRDFNLPGINWDIPVAPSSLSQHKGRSFQ